MQQRTLKLFDRALSLAAVQPQKLGHHSQLGSEDPSVDLGRYTK